MANQYLKAGKLKKDKKISHVHRSFFRSSGVTETLRNEKRAIDRMELQRERQLSLGTFNKGFLTQMKALYILAKLKLKERLRRLFSFSQTESKTISKIKIEKRFPKNPRHYLNGLVMKNSFTTHNA